MFLKLRLDATVDRNRNRITHFLQGRNTVSVSVCTVGTVDRNPLCGKYPLRFPVSVAPTVTVDRNRSRITKKSNPVSVSVFPAVTETFLPRNQFPACPKMPKTGRRNRDFWAGCNLATVADIGLASRLPPLCDM